ncbi:MAG: hypothetical protein AAGH38_01365 [Pseudomonadota bacterium]
MGQVFSSAICLALFTWALKYTGPLSYENEGVLVTAFFMLMWGAAALSLAVALIKLPFSGKK